MNLFTPGSTLPVPAGRTMSPALADDRFTGPAVGDVTPPARRTGSLLPFLVAPLALLALSAQAQDTVPVELSFAGEFAGEPFSCADTYGDVGSSAASVTVSDYRLFVSRVRLLDADGGETPLELDEDGRWQHEGIALLDFEDGSASCSNGTPQTNAVVRGQAPAGDYTGVAFDVGVPFEQNHGDPTLAASPLNLTAMFWNWRGGYRFMRVDLERVVATGSMDPATGEGMEASHGMQEQVNAATTDAAAAGEPMEMAMGGAGHGAGNGWSLHVGSTGCASSSPTSAPSDCAAPNRIEVAFEEFDPTSDTIVVDPARVLEDVDVARNTPDTAPGCMSAPDDPECGPVLDHLGLDGSDAPQTLMTLRR